MFYNAAYGNGWDTGDKGRIQVAGEAVQKFAPSLFLSEGLVVAVALCLNRVGRV